MKVWKEANQKPPFGSELNWASPFNVGKVGCWLFNEGAGSPVNIITCRFVDGALVGSWSPNGMSYGTGQYSREVGWAQQSPPFSQVSIGIPLTGFGTTTMLCHDEPAQQGRINFQLTTDNVRLLLGGSGVSGSVTLTPVANKSVFFASSIDAWAGNGTHYGSVGNGQLKSASSTMGTPVGATKDRMLLGSALYTSIVSYWYNRSLSDSEVAQLYAEPYGLEQYLVPTFTTFWIGVAAGWGYNPIGSGVIGSRVIVPQGVTL